MDRLCFATLLPGTFQLYKTASGPASIRERKKKKKLRGIVPEMGGGQIVYVFTFFFWGKGKHINKIPRKSEEKAGTVPGQSRDNPGTIP